MDVLAYEAAFKSGTPLEISDLLGRIMPGKTISDFETFSFYPGRRLVFVMGGDGLTKIMGKNGFESLVVIGYQIEYIKRLLEQGCSFKLAVFPALQPEDQRANWTNLVRIVSETYPEAAEMLQPRLAELVATPFSQIEASAGYKFAEIQANGVEDSRYMTFERYRKSGGDLIATRAFLYFSAHLYELFKGDGWTYDHEGKRGIREYLTPNVKLSDVKGLKLLDIDVKIPERGK